jgi:hypothetical protein
MNAKIVSLSPPTYALVTSAGGLKTMSAFFWVAGGLVTLAGLALVAMGAVPHDGAFDSGTLTAGTIAAVGGLLLIGIGVTVRELRRIERVIASRPSPAAFFDDDAAHFVEAHNSPRLPLPTKPALSGTPASAAALAVEDATSEHLRTKIPPRELSEEAPDFEAADAAPVTRLPLRSDDFRERRDTAARSYGTNGATPPRAITDVEARPRLAGSPATPKAKVFNAFWSGSQRREPPTSAAQAAAAVARALPTGGPAPVGQTYSDVVAAPSDHPAAVTILKSGVIEGMAYTLYSDGSIEAQLPQGTLRFGSIAALRDHIESKS